LPRPRARHSRTLVRGEYPLPVTWPGTVTVLAGPRLSGKSWVALKLCLAVTGATPFAGNVSTCRGEVLYLALEDNERRLQRRLRVLLEHDGRPPPRGLHIATRWPRLADGGLQQLGDWLSAHPGTRLVVVDTIHRLISPTGRPSPGSLWRELAHRHDLAVVLVCRVPGRWIEDSRTLAARIPGLVGENGAKIFPWNRGRTAVCTG